MNAQGQHFPTGAFVHETRPDWVLQFHEDGRYTFLAGGEVDATGTYSVEGNLYTEDTDYLPCRDARIASYTWTFDGERLVFRLVGEDGCKERRNSLDGVAWVRRL